MARSQLVCYSFFLFFLAPLLSPHSHPLSSVSSSLSSPSWLILTLCCAAHLLQVDFVEMHGKCTAWYLGGVLHVRDMCDEPYAGPACKTFFKMDQSWCCSCVLVCHPRLSPPLPLLFLSFLLLISPSSFFSLPSLIPLTFISDMLWYFHTNDCVLPAYYARANGRADTPPRMGMIPSPFIFSFFFGFMFLLMVI